MVTEWELTQRKGRNGVDRILILALSAQIIDFDHILMIFAQETHYILLAVSIKSFKVFSWIPTGNYSIGDVGQIQVVIIVDESAFIR